MNLFGEDMIIGDFKLSDYGLILASFDSSSSSDEYDLGMNHETIEEFIGSNQVPVYLGAKYSEKLRPIATLVKNPCVMQDCYFTEYECRDILRQLTGYYGYKQMQIFSNEYDELLYFNVRVNNVKYKMISGQVAGIVLEMECDSHFAWTREMKNSYTVNNGTISFYNLSDVLYDYLKPTVTITARSNISELNIINLNDNNWTCTLQNLKKNEVITMDCKNETIKSSVANKNILNNFNLHFIRLVSGINNLQVDSNVKIEIAYKFPRKVGII